MMEKTTAPAAPVPATGSCPGFRQRTKGFLLFVVGLCLGFGPALLGLFRFSISSEVKKPARTKNVGMRKL